LQLIKEKSWVVRLVEGHVLRGEVSSDFCRECNLAPKLIIGNNGDENLLLYGCDTHQCKHIMLRVRLDQQVPSMSPMVQVEEETIPAIESF
jgi:hypothetical protein